MKQGERIHWCYCSIQNCKIRHCLILKSMFGSWGKEKEWDEDTWNPSSHCEWGGIWPEMKKMLISWPSWRKTEINSQTLTSNSDERRFEITSCGIWCPAAPGPWPAAPRRRSAGFSVLVRSVCKTRCRCSTGTPAAGGTPPWRCARPAPPSACPGPPPAGGGCPCAQTQTYKQGLRVQTCTLAYHWSCHSPDLVLTPPDMAWLAAVPPLWPWSQRDIWGAVMGLWSTKQLGLSTCERTSHPCCMSQTLWGPRSCRAGPAGMWPEQRWLRSHPWQPRPTPS